MSNGVTKSTLVMISIRYVVGVTNTSFLPPFIHHIFGKLYLDNPSRKLVEAARTLAPTEQCAECNDTLIDLILLLAEPS